MTTLLLTVSFLLHTVSLFALILLFQRQNNMKQTEQKMRRTAAETEEMMMAFLLELKEENEELIKQLANLRQLKNEKSTTEQPAVFEKEDIILPSTVSRSAAAKAYGNAKKSLKKEKVEIPLAEQMVNMQQQGMGEEEIARKLQVGVTEVKLALKFSRN